MSSSSQRHLKHDHRNLVGGLLSPGQKDTPNAVTASHAAQNEASDSSMQFNADVNRQTTATFSRDILQIEDNSVGDGHFRAEQGHVNVNVCLTLPSLSNSI